MTTIHDRTARASEKGSPGLGHEPGHGLGTPEDDASSAQVREIPVGVCKALRRAVAAGAPGALVSLDTLTARTRTPWR
ncbi:hypothetical protein GCM10023080_092670 [Streptomyces pseudoechinosporeus]